MEKIKAVGKKIGAMVVGDMHGKPANAEAFNALCELYVGALDALGYKPHEAGVMLEAEIHEALMAAGH